MTLDPPDTLDGRLSEVLNLVSKCMPPDQVESTSAFVREFFGGVDPDDVIGRDPADLYGAAVSVWRFGGRRAPEATSLRIYNPKVDEHGWECPHTVIEVVHRDMPFLVDSVRMQINALGFISHVIIHPIVSVYRDADGRVTGIAPQAASRDETFAESFMHLEISRETDAAVLQRLENGLRQALTDVESAVDDWKPMLHRMVETVEEARRHPPPVSGDELSEGVAFLEWLAGECFTYLGCRDYDLVKDDGVVSLRMVPGSGLGILRDRRTDGDSSSFAALPIEVRERARIPEFLTVAKSSTRATVHRPAYADYVGVKRFDASGAVIGERRFLGLFTSVAYNSSVLDVPLVRRKVQAVIERARVVPGSHKAKALLTILETYPRDELFQIAEDDLLRIATGILHLDDRQRTRLFMRRDAFGRFVSALVYLPRDSHNTEVRERMQALLMRTLGGISSDFSVSLSESVLASVLIVTHTPPGSMPEYNERELEAALARVARRWDDELRANLVGRFGEERGIHLDRQYARAFPAGYREDIPARTAVYDIDTMEQIQVDDELAVKLYAPLESDDGKLRLKLYSRMHTIPLSDMLPILECMGVRVIDERPYHIEPADGSSIWMHDAGLETHGVEPPSDVVKDRFRETFVRVWHGDAERDDFNRLVLRAGLAWRDITVLRALAKYSRQTGFTFSQPYMEAALAANPWIAQLLVELFMERHDPARPDRPLGQSTALVAQIEQALDAVPSLDEDRILRRFLATVLAVTRTNYFQRDALGLPKSYLSFKFDPSRIPGLPEPLPMFEVYVYSPRVEGVHLRGGPIARGGLRWSDRMEDFRTEVLGLMKAQMVKNAIIVPVGAKGGFVVKALPSGNREQIQEEVVACYSTFLRGLLDITGSRSGQLSVPPKDVVRHDPDDTYLVVAADKWTATFSDIANDIAAEYAFWMGDAFASGGSTGYDHKRMGITARGAWESVKKRFRTLGVDVQTVPFTAVGIGDMSGDVFGNGMLQSRQTVLVAAFDHRHIFLDPNPDPKASFAERQRMFGLARSSWADYDPTVISRGGGVFPRTAKSITLSPEIKARLQVDANVLTPTELIRAVLRAPVDLLYNGGIGTYVSASDETPLDVGDRSNDAVRVTAAELRCRVVGEGGNLGFTQRARIEYALAGGLVQTDAIDNAGGVDCSDREVNIKILLNAVVADGRLTMKQRNQLLEDMTDEVARLVLQSNYAQAQALAIGGARAAELFDLQVRFIRFLERAGSLRREIEGLPSDEMLAERKAARIALTPPERATLVAHAKLWLFQQLVDSQVPEHPFVAPALIRYFPPELGQRFHADMARHPLAREIISASVSNGLVNRVGSTFVHRLSEETGASPPEVAYAYLIAETIFGVDALWSRVDALDNVVADSLQTSMHIVLVRLLERSAQWLLRHRLDSGHLDTDIARLSTAVRVVSGALESVIGDDDREHMTQVMDGFVAGGVPLDLAHEIAGADYLYASLDISEVAAASGRDLACVTAVYFMVAERLRAPWLLERIALLPTDTRWQALARVAVRSELAEELRAVTVLVLELTADSDQPMVLLNAWEATRSVALTHLREVLDELQTVESPDLAMISVGIREFRTLL